MDHEYNGKDFMSDLLSLYGHVCEKMAKQFEVEHFGPVAISHVADNLDAASLAVTRKKTIENEI